jgi:hypothetical protein
MRMEEIDFFLTVVIIASIGYVICYRLGQTASESPARPIQWNHFLDPTNPNAEFASPADAVYYGKLDLAQSPLPTLGRLSIQNTWLVFVQAHGEQTPVIGLPLSEIRWICHQNMSMQERDTLAKQDMLTLHCVSGKQWGVYTFASPQAEQLARTIQTNSGANYNSHYMLYGPSEIAVRQQNIYGQWSKRKKKVVLYLAPDRLLFNWQSWIELQDIQRLALLPDNSIKINYRSPKGGLRMVGLELKHDQAILWADYLERATGIAVENLAGRKKKSDMK